jgi:hypothetical protein
LFIANVELNFVWVSIKAFFRTFTLSKND